VHIWWPRLEARLKDIPIAATAAPLAPTTEPAKPETTTDEMMTELLRLVRNIDRRSRGARNADSHTSLSSAASRRRKVEEDEAVNRLASGLLASDLGLSTIERRRDSTIIQVKYLPATIPSGGYDLLNAYAIETGRPVVIEDGTRTLRFDAEGGLDELPD